MFTSALVWKTKSCMLARQTILSVDKRNMQMGLLPRHAVVSRSNWFTTKYIVLKKTPECEKIFKGWGKGSSKPLYSTHRNSGTLSINRIKFRSEDYLIGDPVWEVFEERIRTSVYEQTFVMKKVIIALACDAEVDHGHRWFAQGCSVVSPERDRKDIRHDVGSDQKWVVNLCQNLNHEKIE